MLTKLGCFNLAAKFSVINFWVIIYLAKSRVLFSSSLIFIFKTDLVISLVLSSMVFSVLLIFVFKTDLVTKLLVSSILFSISLIFVFKIVVVAKPLVSHIFLSTSLFVFYKKFLSVLCCELSCVMWIKVVVSEIFYLKYLRLPLAIKICNCNNFIICYIT